MRTPEQQLHRDTMARMIWAMRGYLLPAPCSDCGGSGYTGYYACACGWLGIEPRRDAIFVSCPTCERAVTFGRVPCSHTRMARAQGTTLAIEIVRNAFTPILQGDDAFVTLLETIQHRMRQGWLLCERPSHCALAGVRAFGASGL